MDPLPSEGGVSCLVLFFESRDIFKLFGAHTSTFMLWAIPRLQAYSHKKTQVELKKA